LSLDEESSPHLFVLVHPDCSDSNINNTVYYMILCCRALGICIVVVTVGNEKEHREPFKYNNRNTMGEGFQCNVAPLSSGRRRSTSHRRTGWLTMYYTIYITSTPKWKMLLDLLLIIAVGLPSKYNEAILY